MVAKREIKIKDNCLAPANFIYLRYDGPSPFAIAEKIGDTLEDFFHVSAAGVNEMYFGWDVSGEPKGFLQRWWVKKEFSGFTTMWVFITTQGEVDEAGKGWFNTEMTGELRTSFESPNPFLKMLWIMYTHIFYNRVRRNYLVMCRDFLEELRNELKEHFNLKILDVGA